jgi:hypothetical protein
VSSGEVTFKLHSASIARELWKHLADRTEAYLFQISTGKFWESSSVLGRTLNGLLERLEIPKIDPKLLAKFVGKDRTTEQATRSEKRHASAGLHSFRQTNATAMDSLGIALAVRKQRIRDSAGTATELYTHTFAQDERGAADKLGELFGTSWPEMDKGKVISFPNLSQKEEGLPIGDSEALVNQ